jgi:hypothetical protein
MTPCRWLPKLDQTICLTNIAGPTSHETNQSTSMTGLFNYAYFWPLPPVLCLLKPIVHVCTLKMAEDELSLTLPLPTVCPKLCNKPPFSAFTMPLYLAFRGGWPDLACESQEFGPWVRNSSFRSSTPQCPHPTRTPTHPQEACRNPRGPSALCENMLVGHRGSDFLCFLWFYLCYLVPFVFQVLLVSGMTL